MNLKHKLGDKVKIRRDLKVGKRYDGVLVNEEMIKLVGKILTVSDINYFDEDDISYYLNEDKYCYHWTDEMFEDSMTNADKIRSMDNEELAEFLRKATLGAASCDLWTEWLTSDKWEQ